MVDAAVEVVAAATGTESIAVAAAAEDAIANIDTIVCDEHLRTLMHRGLIGALLAHETNPHNLLSKTNVRVRRWRARRSKPAHACTGFAVWDRELVMVVLDLRS